MLVEVCWEGWQATCKAAGKVQHVHTAAQSSAKGTEDEAAQEQLPWKGGCELSRKGGCELSSIPGPWMHCGIRQSCCGFVSIVMKHISVLAWYHMEQTGWSSSIARLPALLLPRFLGRGCACSAAALLGGAAGSGHLALHFSFSRGCGERRGGKRG